MSKLIIHVTDPHFGNEAATYKKESIKTALINKINEMTGQKILILSGDITFKARKEGYTEAISFFQEVIDRCQISRNNVIACPGNHDISPGTSPFEPFDNFLYALRRDNLLSNNTKNETITELSDTIIITTNSAHHLDRTHGLIPNTTIEMLNTEHRRIKEFKYKIFITHHHLLNQIDNDTSTTRNSLQLIHALNRAEFTHILHGHQHSTLDLTIGDNKVAIVSGRSLNFHDKGYHNGFNAIDLNKSTIRKFIATPDKKPSELTFEELR